MTTGTIETDIAIAGAGLAGMSAAAILAASGHSVTIVDPAPPVTDGEADGADWRTTALLQPSRDALGAAGVWQRLDEEASALQVMRIVETGDASAGLTRDFDAADLGDEPFGWNLPNWYLRRVLCEHLAEGNAIRVLTGVAVTGWTSRTAEARLRLSDGGTITARLAIAMDGRDSTLRKRAGIGARRVRYGQKALAFAVTHPIPHNRVSSEIHRSGGPFTLVPLPDRDRRPASAVVWMERSAEADRLAGLSEDAFNAEATERSTHLLGPLKLVSQRTVWPIISQIADRFAGERLAIAGEAAHVMPPIGAQGLNTSLGDISCLERLIGQGDGDPGTPDILDRYARARRPEVLARMIGIDALNRTSMAGAEPLRVMRSLGVRALHDIAPVRRAIMRLGLGRSPA